MEGFKPSPIFEYFVYSIYRMRGEESCRMRIFKVYHSGYKLAMDASDSLPEQEEINDFKRFNKVDVFFKCVKRRGIECKPESFRGFLEFVSDVELTKPQLDFFTANRVMMK